MEQLNNSYVLVTKQKMKAGYNENERMEDYVPRLVLKKDVKAQARAQTNFIKQQNRPRNLESNQIS